MVIRVLKHIAHHVRNLRRGALFGVHSVYNYVTLRGLVQAVHHFDGRGFARAVLPNNGHALALLNAQVQFFIGKRAVRVTERSVFKFDAIQCSLPPFQHKASGLL